MPLAGGAPRRAPADATSRLLLDACGTAVGWREAAVLGDRARAAVDWDALADAAERHMVAALVHRALAAVPDVPRPTLQRLAAVRDAVAVRNLALTRALLEIVDALDARGVPSIPIKGPVLAVAAYGDVAARQFGDLDLIVRRGDVDAAHAVLHELGYAPGIALDAGAEAALSRADYHAQFISRDAVTVELHWALGRSGSGALADDAWAWSNARQVVVLGRTLAALPAEPLLVYLCAHGGKHAWKQLGWVCDVAAVMRASPAIDWERAATIASHAGVRRALALGVYLAHQMLGTGLDAPTRAGVLPDARAARLAATITPHLLIPPPPSVSRQVSFQYQLRERLRDRVAFGAQLLTAPHLADVQRISFPPALRLLYRVVRPIRLASKHFFTRAAGRGQTRR